MNLVHAPLLQTRFVQHVHPASIAMEQLLHSVLHFAQMETMSQQLAHHLPTEFALPVPTSQATPTTLG